MKRKSRKVGPRLTVSLTGPDYDRLNALADKEDVSVSWVIRRAINEYLAKHRKEIEGARDLSAYKKWTGRHITCRAANGKGGDKRATSEAK